MTLEATKHAIEVMQAYVDGKEVECLARRVSGDEWEKVVSPAWNWIRYDYRIKPEPREYYLNIYKEAVTVFANRIDANVCAKSDRVACIKVREVIEE